MKKMILIPMLIIALLSSLTVISNALSFGMQITPGIVNVPPGQSVDIYLTTQNMNVGSSGMNIVSVILNYDNTIFEDIKQENITGLNDWNFEYDAQEKRIIMDNPNYIKEEGQLCKISFKLKDTVTEGSTEISLSNATASNETLEIIGTGSTAIVNIKKVSSEKYEITENNQIKGVELNTTVDQLKANIIGSENATIKDANGNVITSNSKVGTGTTVSIPGEEPFTVIIKGDVDGDGAITMMDIAKIQLNIVKIEMLEGAYLIAGDVDVTEGISILDLAKVLLHYVGIESL